MDIRIESSDNPRIKAAVRLRRHRGRSRQDRILIDGAREISRALDGGIELLELFVLDPLPENETVRRIWQRLEQSGVVRLRVNEQLFQRIAYGDRDEGIVAVARPPVRGLEQLRVRSDAVVAVLENLEKPGNVGAIIRTADAAGLAGVIVVDGGTDLFNPNTIRASLGTVFTIPSVSTTSEAAAAWLRASDFQIVSCRVDAPLSYSEPVYAKRTAIVLGSEAEGLSDFWHGKDITSVAIPLRGHVDSLNVSSTAAVMFFEVTRQREERVGLRDEG